MKAGVGPTQVRSVRTPVLAEVLALAPEASWRWLAAVPRGLVPCRCRAGRSRRARRSGRQRTHRVVDGGVAAAAVPARRAVGSSARGGRALLIRRNRNVGAAAVCLLATALRELFGISLLAGLLLGVTAARGWSRSWPRSAGRRSTRGGLERSSTQRASIHRCAPTTPSLGSSRPGRAAAPRS